MDKKWSKAADRKKILDEGGKLPDAEKQFWSALPASSKRLLAILPTMIHEALAELVEKHGMEISQEILYFLNISASKALLYMDHPRASAQVIQKDARTFLSTTNADDGKQAALAVCYLILQLAEEGRIPGAHQSQAVLAATAIMEEAKQDGKTGDWKMDPARVAYGAKALKDRLTTHGYLLVH